MSSLSEFIEDMDQEIRFALIEEILKSIEPIAKKNNMTPLSALTQWMRFRLSEQQDEQAKDRLEI